MLRDEAVRGLQDVLLGAIEQEHGVVAQRAARGRQRAQRLQQHRAARAVVAGACATTAGATRVLIVQLAL